MFTVIEKDTIYVKNKTTRFTSKDKKSTGKILTIFIIKTKYYYIQYKWIGNFKT
jgi:hypothetical protein